MSSWWFFRGLAIDVTAALLPVVVALSLKIACGVVDSAHIPRQRR